MSGRVTKSAGGQVVVGARVVLDRGRATITDEDGLYYFENIQSGKHKIKVTAGLFSCVSFLSFPLGKTEATMKKYRKQPC